jgi:16S rRNA (guanine527-N7)-methyltransferase
VFHVEQGDRKEPKVPSPRNIALPSKRFLAGLIAGAGLSVPPGAGELLISHAREVLRWNRSIRLTAITAPEEVAVKHILDSLLLLRFAPFPGRILDFGSGAGYPGIPLAVALPGSRVVLLESSGKKCAFLSHALQGLSLGNADVVHARLERRNILSLGQFEHIVTRATLPREEAVPLLLPYLAPGGRFLLMQGPRRGEGKREKPGRGNSSLQGAAQERSVRIELPLAMGFRVIQEITNPVGRLEDPECPGSQQTGRRPGLPE